MPKQSHTKLILCSGVAMMAIGLLTLGASLGVFWNQQASNTSTPSEADQIANIEKMVLNADNAARGEAMSLATGLISNDVEGLFVLDHLTGNLSCIVLSPRNGQAGGSLFSTNVNNDLGAAKAGKKDFLMTTGYINAVVGGRVGQLRPADCVVYVADGNTGQVAGYTLQYNRTFIENGQGQGGQLRLVWKGASRPNAMRRDQN